MSDRLNGSLFGLFAGDAVAMPVHWMYNLNLLKRDYGKITQYVAPLDRFEGSIMNKSNTGGAGRGNNKGSIIGDVINHGKKHYWAPDQQNHYHLGLKAGENTLEAQLTRLSLRHITANKGYNIDLYRDEYMKFMQTPGSHNDCYAATAHRMFFENLMNGKDPKLCPDNDQHNVDAIDALTVSVPVIIQYRNDDAQLRNKKVMESIRVLRNVQSAEPYALLFSDMLVDILDGKDLKTVVQGGADALGMGSLEKMVKKTRGDPMAACYISQSFPVMLFLVYKYSHSVEEALLANANAGGENVARGALVGALMGAAYGMEAFPTWAQKLHNYQQIIEEINNFNGTKEEL